MDKEFENWLATRPKVIQELAKKYPPDLSYRIRNGAPYRISSAGSIVNIYSYKENGNINVVVPAKYKPQSTIEHEKYLGEKFGRTKEEMEKIHDSDILVEVDPIWLEPILQKHNEN